MVLADLFALLVVLNWRYLASLELLDCVVKGLEALLHRLLQSTIFTQEEETLLLIVVGLIDRTLQSVNLLVLLVLLDLVESLFCDFCLKLVTRLDLLNNIFRIMLSEILFVRRSVVLTLFLFSEIFFLFLSMFPIMIFADFEIILIPLINR